MRYTGVIGLNPMPQKDLSMEGESGIVRKNPKTDVCSNQHPRIVVEDKIYVKKCKMQKQQA
jgi:hypothetical protein